MEVSRAPGGQWRAESACGRWTHPGLIVQLQLAEVLVHGASAALAGAAVDSAAGTAAAAVTAVEDAALGGRVDREGGRHGLAAPGRQLAVAVYLGGDAVDAAVAVFTALAQSP